MSGAPPEAERLRRTPLHAEHAALGAKLVPFAGYEMPIQYPTGITAEHQAVRRAAGLFDVSHMGEVEVHGPDALRFVQHVTTNDASRLGVGQAQYSTLPREDGTLLDDLLVYRLPEHYLLVVNGSNRERDVEWLRHHTSDFDVELRDRSDEIALLALQGPHAERILQRVTEDEIGSIRYYHFRQGQVAGLPALISRTGYTGEDGFELYVAAKDAAPLWRALLEEGAPDGLVPAGLGCRDSLRLEMGYALYGNDLDDGTTPLEAGLGWVTRLDKGHFVATDALRRQKEQGAERRLVGFRLRERGFPRTGYPVLVNGERVGTVTSGVLSPSTGEGIGMAYVPVGASKPGTELEVEIRGRPVPAEVVRPPFYTGGSLRK
ncbi:MAG: glycine cleavage system aminomethyltransferase GcvT [Gemmatimonadota bacterium]|nr:glycine cleavage system aminomethyltransferase GcvT [Gemmatimonadota bacterium]